MIINWKRFVFIITALLFILVIVVGVNSAPTQTGTTKKTTPAYKLAAIETNNAQPNKTLVDSFQKILDQLVQKCQEKEEVRISDYIVKAQQMLAERKKKFSLLQIANGLNESMPDSPELEPFDCAGMTATWIALVTTN